jgi:hypothetical protein
VAGSQSLADHPSDDDRCANVSAGDVRCFLVQQLHIPIAVPIVLMLGHFVVSRFQGPTISSTPPSKPKFPPASVGNLFCDHELRWFAADYVGM